MPKLVNKFSFSKPKKAKNNGFCGEKYRSNDTSALKMDYLASEKANPFNERLLFIMWVIRESGTFYGV